MLLLRPEPWARSMGRDTREESGLPLGNGSTRCTVAGAFHELPVAECTGLGS